MTPVISPWVFYLMPVCEKFGILTAIVGGTGVISLLITLGMYLDNASYLDDDEKKSYKRVAKTILVLTIVFILLTCVIPSEETLTKMIVAQNVTVERVEVVSDTVVTVYNDIMALFQDSGAANG